MSDAPKAKDRSAPASFAWEDPFLLDEQLSEDERLIRDAARAYAQEKLAPCVADMYMNEGSDLSIACVRRVDAVR